MPGIGDSWGTREELLHPRGPNGRWIRSGGVPQGIIGAILELLAGFRPRTFQSRQQANQYTHNLAGRGSSRMSSRDLGRLAVDLPNANEDLVDGVIDDPSTKRFVEMMDRSAIELPEDMILSMTVGTDSFGFTPETANGTDADTDPGIRGVSGKLIANRGYLLTATTGPLPNATPGPGRVRLIVAAPKGTKAIVPGAGPNDSTLFLDREQPLRVTKVEPDGAGGWNMYVAATGDKVEGEIPQPIAGHVGPGKPADREARVRNMDRLEKQLSRAESDEEVGAESQRREAARQAMLQEVTANPPAQNPRDQVPPPGTPPPRTEPVVTESIGGVPGQAPAPEAAPEVPAVPQRTVDLRLAVRDANIPSPTEGPYRKKFNEAYLGIVDGRKDPIDAVRDLDADLRDIDRGDVLLQARGREHTPEQVEESRSALQELRDLIAREYGLESPRPGVVQKKAAKAAAPALPRTEEGLPRVDPAQAQAAMDRAREQSRREAGMSAPGVTRGTEEKVPAKALRTPAKKAAAPSLSREQEDQILEQAQRIGDAPKGDQDRRTLDRAAKITAKRAAPPVKVTGKAVRNPRDIAASLREAKTREEADAALEGLTLKELKDVAIELDMPIRSGRGTKAAVREDLVEFGTGKRLDVDAVLGDAERAAKAAGFESIRGEPAKKAAPRKTSRQLEAEANALVGRRGKESDAKIARLRAQSRLAELEERGKEPDLDKLTKEELLAVAEKRDVTVTKSWTKDRIKAALRGETPAPVKRAPAAKKAAPKPPFDAKDIGTRIKGAKTREEADAALDGLTVDQLKQVAREIDMPLRQQGAKKDLLRADIVDSAVGTRLDSEAIANMGQEMLRGERRVPRGLAGVPNPETVRQQLIDMPSADRPAHIQSVLEPLNVTQARRLAKDLSVRGQERNDKAHVADAIRRHFEGVTPEAVERLGGPTPAQERSERLVPMAELVAEVDQLVNDEASPRALAQNMRTRLRLHPEFTDPEVDELIKMAEAGEGVQVRQHLRELAARNGVIIEGRAGDVVPFDRQIHESIGRDIPDGEMVTLIRPGTQIRLGDDDTVRHKRAAVQQSSPEETRARRLVPEGSVPGLRTTVPVDNTPRKKELREAWRDADIQRPRGAPGRQLDEIKEKVLAGDVSPEEGIRLLESEIAFNKEDRTELEAHLRDADLDPGERREFEGRLADLDNGIEAQETTSKFLRLYFKDETPSKEEVRVEVVPEVKDLLPKETVSWLDGANPEDIDEGARLAGLDKPKGDTAEEKFEDAIRQVIVRELESRKAQRGESGHVARDSQARSGWKRGDKLQHKYRGEVTYLQPDDSDSLGTAAGPGGAQWVEFDDGNSGMVTADQLSGYVPPKKVAKKAVKKAAPTKKAAPPKVPVEKEKIDARLIAEDLNLDESDEWTKSVLDEVQRALDGEDVGGGLGPNPTPAAIGRHLEERGHSRMTTAVFMHGGWHHDRLISEGDQEDLDRRKAEDKATYDEIKDRVDKIRELAERLKKTRRRPAKKGPVPGSTPTDTQAREWGQANGYEGRAGGWIYKDGKPVVQGWSGLAVRNKKQINDDLIQRAAPTPAEEKVDVLENRIINDALDRLREGKTPAQRRAAVAGLTHTELRQLSKHTGGDGTGNRNNLTDELVTRFTPEPALPKVPEGGTDEEKVAALRRRATVARQLAGMRQGNNPPGSFHHNKGLEDEKEADRLDAEADAMERAMGPSSEDIRRELAEENLQFPEGGTPRVDEPPTPSDFLAELSREDERGFPILDRDSAMAMLKERVKTKKQLQEMAREVSIPGVGRLTVDELRRMLVEATVGARRDSIATRGFTGPRPGIGDVGGRPDVPDVPGVTPAPAKKAAKAAPAKKAAPAAALRVGETVSSGRVKEGDRLWVRREGDEWVRTSKKTGSVPITVSRVNRDTETRGSGSRKQRGYQIDGVDDDGNEIKVASYFGQNTFHRVEGGEGPAPAKKAAPAAAAPGPTGTSPADPGLPIRRAYRITDSRGRIERRERPKADEPVYLPNGGADQGRVHLDSDLGTLWADLYLDNREPNSFINEIAHIGEDVGTGKLPLATALTRLKTMKDRATDRTVADRIQKAIDNMDAPPVTVPDLPDTVPEVVKKALRELAEIPTARRTGQVGMGRRNRSVFDEKLGIVLRIDEGDDDRDLDMRLRNRDLHESVDGALEMWRLFEILSTSQEVRRWRMDAYRRAQAAKVRS